MTYLTHGSEEGRREALPEEHDGQALGDPAHDGLMARQQRQQLLERRQVLIHAAGQVVPQLLEPVECGHAVLLPCDHGGFAPGGREEVAEDGGEVGCAERAHVGHVLQPRRLGGEGEGRGEGQRVGRVRGCGMRWCGHRVYFILKQLTIRTRRRAHVKGAGM